jgi:hypothetical protein
MYKRIFRKATHTRRFTISDTGSSGWEIRDEQDSHILRWTHYHDWHRVERARMVFAREALRLGDAGWEET